jgi:DNA-binding CsgD family transcriptional regulator
MGNVYEAPARSAVVKLFKQGKRPKEISLELNMSRQRVYQHIERARQLGELPPSEQSA